MKKLVAALLLIVTPAIAQDVTLTVNQKDLAQIGQGLGKLPFDEVSPLFNKLQNQVMEQQKKVEAPKPAEKPVDNETKK